MAEYSVLALSLASNVLQEESPGSIGYSTSENRSCWQQQEMQKKITAIKGKGEKVV